MSYHVNRIPREPKLVVGEKEEEEEEVEEEKEKEEMEAEMEGKTHP